MSAIVPYLYLCLAMVLVGSSAVAGKLMLAGLPLFLSSSLRFGLSFGLLLPILLGREGRLPRLSAKSLGIMALQALCGSFLFSYCLLKGLNYASAAEAGVITSLTPACMGLAGWILGGQKPGPRALLGMLLAGAGIWLLEAPASPHESGLNLGWLFFLAAVVFESMFLLLRKNLREPLSPLAAATLVSGLGLLYFLPFGLFEALDCDFAAVPPSAWLAVGYYGVCVTALAYILWFAGVVYVPAPAAGAVTGVMPLCAVGFSWLLLNEPRPANLLPATLLVVLAVVFSAKC